MRNYDINADRNETLPIPTLGDLRRATQDLPDRLPLMGVSGIPIKGEIGLNMGIPNEPVLYLYEHRPDYPPGEPF